jgi:hypothetical protein
MLSFFLVEEVTVRESGESAVFDAGEYRDQDLLLTFGITHAIENESIGIHIKGSQDGLHWSTKSVVSFAPKFYCGSYHLVLHRCEVRYLKAVWSVLRWSRGDRPFFRFYIRAQSARNCAVAAGAA